jgi:hypothetical protein
MRVGHCLPTVLVLFFNAGCGLGTIVHTPKDYKLDEPWPTVKTSGPVAVRSGNAAAGRFAIDLPMRSMTVDLREYTEALVHRVRAALVKQGVAVEPGAPTAIEIEVVYVNILEQMRYHCVVDFTVRAANGYVRGHQARDESGTNPPKACNAALSRAAFELLNDEVLQRYLAGPS